MRHSWKLFMAWLSLASGSSWALNYAEAQFASAAIKEFFEKDLPPRYKSVMRTTEKMIPFVETYLTGLCQKKLSGKISAPQIAETSN